MIGQQVQGEDFNAQSPITLCNAGQGYTTTYLSLVKRTIPAGARFVLTGLSARVLDAGSNDIYFSVLRNGMVIDQGLTDIPGTVFDFTQRMDFQFDLAPGDIEIIARNISGTGLPNPPYPLGGADPAANIRLQAEWFGKMTRPRIKVQPFYQGTTGRTSTPRTVVQHSNFFKSLFRPKG